jgi:hypothetical protein
MASHAKHGWSALQSVFTAPKFSATVGDALTASLTQVHGVALCIELDTD